MMKTYKKPVNLIIILLLTIFSSCELERLDAETAAAPGGGTLDTFTAYTIDSTDPMGSNVFGRIVFWKTDLDQTLVQISLESTNFDNLREATPIGSIFTLSYPSEILSGPVGVDDMSLETLFDVELFQQTLAVTTEADVDDLDGDGNTDELLPDIDDFDRDGDVSETLPTLIRYWAEFGENKFFLIPEANFYDGLGALDAHINIYDEDGSTIIASANIGVNGTPVDSN